MVMSKGANRDQVQNVVAQMRDVRSNRGAALRKMLNENEKATRETVSAELEVKNYKASQKRLKDETARLQKELKQAKLANVKGQGLVKEARVEANELTRQNASLTSGTDKLTKDVSQLKSDTTKLDKEVSLLDSQRDKLTADADRLKDLRSKYMSELAKFKVK